MDHEELNLKNYNELYYGKKKKTMCVSQRIKHKNYFRLD